MRLRMLAAVVWIKMGVGIEVGGLVRMFIAVSCALSSSRWWIGSIKRSVSKAATEVARNGSDIILAASSCILPNVNCIVAIWPGSP